MRSFVNTHRSRWLQTQYNTMVLIHKSVQVTVQSNICSNKWERGSCTYKCDDGSLLHTSIISWSLLQHIQHVHTCISSTGEQTSEWYWWWPGPWRIYTFILGQSLVPQSYKLWGTNLSSLLYTGPGRLQGSVKYDVATILHQGHH